MALLPEKILLDADGRLLRPEDPIVALNDIEASIGAVDEPWNCIDENPVEDFVYGAEDDFTDGIGGLIWILESVKVSSSGA